MNIEQLIEDYKNHFVIMNGQVICELNGYYEIDNKIYLSYIPLHSTAKNAVSMDAVMSIETANILPENLN